MKSEVDHEVDGRVSLHDNRWPSVRPSVRPQATDVNPEWSRKVGFHVATLVGDQSRTKKVGGNVKSYVRGWKIAW